MMKKLLFLTLAIFAQAVFAGGQSHPDILVYSRTESQWNVFLLKEFRTFMNNLSMSIDPYRYDHQEDLVYSEDNITVFISSDAQNLLDTVSTASGIDILDVIPELTVSGVGYSVSSIEPHINPVEQADGNVVLESDISITGIEAHAKELKLSFILTQMIQGKKVPALEVKIINPKVVLNEGRKIDFALNLLLKEKKEAIELDFKEGDFSRLTKSLREDPEMIDIVYDDIAIPDVSINFMGRNISVNEDKIKEIIASHKPSLKVILIDQVRALFEKDGAMELLKHFNGTKIDRDYWISTDSESVFPIMLGIKDFSVPMKGVLKTELQGDFCTTVAYQSYGEDCVNRRVTAAPKSTTTKADFAYSQTNINSLLSDNQDVKFLASLSEDYINKVIVTTIDYGIWQPIIDDIGVEMGDKGVLVKLDKTGKNATVLLDVIYDVGKVPGLILSQRKLRFPVVLNATIRAQYYEVEKKQEDGSVKKTSEPHIVFNINDVNLDDTILTYGHQKYGFPSTVQNVRKFLGLRNIVIKKIKKELFDYDAPTEPEKFSKWKGVDLPPILLPEIKDMYLEKMNLDCDAHGRMNLILKGSETLYRD